MKTKHEIIDEVAGIYNSGNRSKILVTTGITTKYQCLYNGDDNRHCAFAMMCIDPSILIEGKTASHNLENFGHEILKPEYRGHEDRFYNAIQSIHDSDSNWDENGLSLHGQFQIKFFKEVWSLN